MKAFVRRPLVPIINFRENRDVECDRSASVSNSTGKRGWRYYEVLLIVPINTISTKPQTKWHIKQEFTIVTGILLCQIEQTSKSLKAMESVFLHCKSTPPYDGTSILKKRRKENVEWGTKWFLTVLRHSFMGTLPINVAACLFQREIPSFNVVWSFCLLLDSQYLHHAQPLSCLSLCTLFTLCAHLTSYNYTFAFHVLTNQNQE